MPCQQRAGERLQLPPHLEDVLQAYRVDLDDERAPVRMLDDQPQTLHLLQRLANAGLRDAKLLGQGHLRQALSRLDLARQNALLQLGSDRKAVVIRLERS